MKRQYALCDFCHKAKSVDDMEKITVIYRKCKNCNPDNLAGSNVPQMEERRSVRAVRRVLPPPHLREVFKPPFSENPESSNVKVEKSKAEEENKKEVEKILGDGKPTSK